MSEASIPQPGVFTRHRLLPRLDGSAVACGLAIVGVGGIAAANGGYFPTSWGWAAIAFAWVGALAVLLRSATDVGRLDLAFFGLLTAFAGWIWLSAFWSQSAPSSILEGERALVAVAGVGTALILVARRSVPQLLAGVSIAITLIAAYALATRLFPAEITSFDPIAGYRLQEPVGYWNALGIFSALGAILCFAFAMRASTVVARGLAAGALAFLLPPMYFTFSRGAWVALAIGIVAAVALDPRRLQLAAGLAALAPVLALEVWIASRQDALTHRLADLASATHQGHRYALVVVGAAVVTAALSLAFATAERRVTVPRLARLGFAAAVGLLVLAVVVAAFARYGSPPTMARKAWHSFEKPLVSEGSSNLNKRLFSLSGNGRVAVWRSAWHDHDANPGLGSGAGTFQQWWYAHRDSDFQVVDAHSLYLEALAEVGPVGLALIALALLVPAAAAVTTRRQPLVPIAFGAYVAYVAHAAVDWDWEVTAVTLAGLLVGVGLVAGARRGEPRPLGRAGRSVFVAGAVAVGALAFVVLVGNLKLARAQTAAADRNWHKAAADAQSASNWAPWSSQALQTLAQAQGKLGRHVAQVTTLREAVKKDPNDSDLWYDLSAATTGATSSGAFVTSVRLDPYGFVAKDRRAVLGKGFG